MAAKKSAQNPHQWPNGEWHSIPWSQAKQNPANQGPAKGLPGGMNTLGPPPVGTYDSGIDYNAGTANRGFENTKDDAATAYSQGQEDYGLGLGDLTRGRDRTLTDLGLSETRATEDYYGRSTDLARQFGILGRQQAERAAQQGIQSAGLLSKSQQVRAANQQLEQNDLDRQQTRNMQDIALGRTRVNEDFDRGKTGLDLGNARAFGGYGGNTILNPITGQPQVGSLLTSLTRAGTENTNFQTYSAGQRTAQAAANGYVPPGMIPPAPGSRTGAAQAFTRKQKQRGLIT